MRKTQPFSLRMHGEIRELLIKWLPDEAGEIERLKAHDNVQELLIEQLILSVEVVLELGDVLVLSLPAEKLEDVELSALHVHGHVYRHVCRHACRHAYARVHGHAQRHVCGHVYRHVCSGLGGQRSI